MTKRTEQILAMIKIAGIVVVIPFMLAVYIALGYYAGHAFDLKFKTDPFGAWIATALGITGAVRETMRVIKFAIRIEEKTHGAR